MAVRTKEEVKRSVKIRKLQDSARYRMERHSSNGTWHVSLASFVFGAAMILASGYNLYDTSGAIRNHESALQDRARIYEEVRRVTTGSENIAEDQRMYLLQPELDRFFRAYRVTDHATESLNKYQLRHQLAEVDRIALTPPSPQYAVSFGFGCFGLAICLPLAMLIRNALRNRRLRRGRVKQSELDETEVSNYELENEVARLVDEDLGRNIEALLQKANADIDEQRVKGSSLRAAEQLLESARTHRHDIVAQVEEQVAVLQAIHGAAEAKAKESWAEYNRAVESRDGFKKIMVKQFRLSLALSRDAEFVRVAEAAANEHQRIDTPAVTGDIAAEAGLDVATIEAMVGIAVTVEEWAKTRV